MNKSALKTFATSARKELLKKVEAKAMKIGITEETIKKADVESSDAIFIDGRQLLKEEKTQRDKLIARINQIGFKQVMEEVAYTWFNRFTALRYMEVNDYLPTGIRVLSSSSENSADPDMLNEALELDLEVELDKEHIYNLKLNNETEELFKYLIIKHCNDLNRFLPFMFETIDDYTEILFPEGLLAKESFIRQMTNSEFIPEDNWKKVEVIGWLYQYYIAEEKDRVIQAKKKYKSEEIPFATQLFTPEWIVRYMVQNTLGRYWVEAHPEHQDIIRTWDYYLENPNPGADFEKKMAPYINKELKVEDIKCFDPAMGSGHILVYVFDVLYEIYTKCGYMEREIPRLIIENNLYGLDIDDRAYQLACFSIVMKAMEYNGRFFRNIEREGLTLNLASIQETNTISDEDIMFMSGENVEETFGKLKSFLEQFKNAKTIGSLIKVDSFDKEFIEKRINEIRDNLPNDLFEFEKKERTYGLLQKILHQATIIEQKYDVFITNPPYAGNKYLPIETSNYLVQCYPDVKSDLFSAFIEYSFHATKDNGQIGFITPFVWMFITTFEPIRKKIVEEKNISSLVQLEYNGFEAAMVPVCLFTMRNYQVNIKGEFINLSEFKGIENQPIKTLEAVRNPKVSYRFTFDQENFSKIPGSPIAYWVSDNFITVYKNRLLEEIAFSDGQILTGNNEKYLKNIWEVDASKVSPESDWVLHAKGGEYRRWYGNIDTVVSWSEESRNHYKNDKIARFPKENILFRKGITWTLVSSNPDFGVRFLDEDLTFNKAAASILFNDESKIKYVLGFLNSKVAQSFLKVLNPTLNTNIKDVLNMPYIESENYFNLVEEIVNENIKISKGDWDNFETSWGFRKHPFIVNKMSTLEETYKKWKAISDENFFHLKRNEEKLNNIFIAIYGLEGDLSPIVKDKTVSLNKADLIKDIKSFISYAIGCILGRYSLDEEGLAFAGGEFNVNKYKIFSVDKDNILPILPGAYFEDDIVSRFIEFVKVTFGEETLNENLDFLSNTLGKKKGETAKETIRRYFLNDFFKDHVQTYKKRPIYWLFTSGKQKAFNCLIYMHRYDKTTLSRIRTDYLHEYQIRLDAEKKDLLSIIEGDYTTKEISNAKKELKALDKKIEELKEYDELLHHMADMQIEIDLDDGVAVNYEKFKGLVAKI